MARPRNSRSPSPAGRRRRDDHRNIGRDRDRNVRPRDRHDSRDLHPRDRRRSRSRSLERRYRQRDGDDLYRGKDDDRFSYVRDSRDRRRSRSRDRGARIRSRSPLRRRGTSREDRNRRDPRPRDSARTPQRRDSAADPLAASKQNTLESSRSLGSVASPGAQVSNTKLADNTTEEEEQKKQRLAKLEAWKKKVTGAKAVQEKHASNDTVGGAVSSKVSDISVKSPAAGDTPATLPPKRDQAQPLTKPGARSQEPKVLGAIKGQVPDASSAVSKVLSKVQSGATASALPQHRMNMSGFGFSRTADADKQQAKRKLMTLDDEEASKRKLAKLPAFDPKAVDEEQHDGQNGVADGDDEDEADFGGTEEEAAAAARAAQERREARIAKESAAQAEAQAAANRTGASHDIVMTDAPPVDDISMEVDAPAEDEVDPLDAYMADLEKNADAAPQKGTLQAPSAVTARDTEAFFSDDEYEFGEGVPGDTILTLATKRKKKDIPAIDYSKLDLEPIRKDFWTEPQELQHMTEAELAELRHDLDGIKVKGKNVPKPVQRWSHCGLPRQTLDIIEKLGFEKPTTIQMQAIPAVMSGRDVIAVAKTGSGKTLAFLIPMFRHIGDQSPLKNDDGPIALIMTPTRELATQIHRDCRPFLKARGLRAVCAYGGAPIRDHIAELKRGAEIVVCTPGRWIDLLAANQGRVTNLKRVTYVVLDEADRMFDMGFEPQVMKIFANIRPDHQTILFSATMPRIIDALTKKVLKNPVEIEVGGRSVVAPEITQIVEVRNEKDKFVRLLELLGELYAHDEDVRTLVFVERQEKADYLLAELIKKGYACLSIHGGMDQVDRDSFISDFKRGVVPILVATSVAARGLDVKQLKLVVNYDAPNHLEDYVHRAGRTGRAGNKGTAVTFITDNQDNCAACIAKALEQSGQQVPEQVAELRKAFREKVKAGKAKDVSGFGGKGLDKLDKEREATKLLQRKAHKAEEGEEDGGDDKKGAADKSAKIAGSGTIVTRGSGSTAGSAGASLDAEKLLQLGKIVIHKRQDPSAAPAPSLLHSSAASLASAVTAVAQAASAARNTANNSTGANTGNPLDKVAERVNGINQRLGRAGQLRSSMAAGVGGGGRSGTGKQLPSQPPIENKGPDAGAYHATLEINEFPQKARWAVTNRTNVAKILEATGTSITTKGTFYPAGKSPQPGQDPKLYILVEGDTELVVAKAMVELQRLLAEATMAAAELESRAPVGGRYVVS